MVIAAYGISQLRLTCATKRVSHGPKSTPLLSKLIAGSLRFGPPVGLSKRSRLINWSMLRSDSPRPPDAGRETAGGVTGAPLPDVTGGAEVGGAAEGGAGVAGPRSSGAVVPSIMSALLPRENGMSFAGCGARSADDA